MPHDLAYFHAGGGAQVQMQVALADACRTKPHHASGTQVIILRHADG